MGDDQPPPKFLLLYGSLRERSYSRLVVEEAARLALEELGPIFIKFGQALSTRQSIAVSALALANQSQQSVLQLLR